MNFNNADIINSAAAGKIVFCTNCGAQNSTDNAFCTTCGSKLSIPVVNEGAAEVVSEAFPTAEGPEVKVEPAFQPATEEPEVKAEPAFQPATEEPEVKVEPAFQPATEEPEVKAEPAFQPAESKSHAPVVKYEVPPSAFAEGLPPWSVEPPNAFVKRRK